mgnify:CR=1 FL=1
MHMCLFRNIDKEVHHFAGTFLCPFCTGSGLTSIFNLPDSWLIDVENETYEDCSGWLRGANDCFAYKGFQIIKITSPNKKDFYIINTHMDAGRRDSDRYAREKQLENIISAVNKKKDLKALIVAGDLNLNSKDPGDMELLKQFKNELSLMDTFEDTQIDARWSSLRKGLQRSHSSAASDGGRTTRPSRFFVQRQLCLSRFESYRESRAEP